MQVFTKIETAGVEIIASLPTFYHLHIFFLRTNDYEVPAN
jgi:hypothetical protein